MRTEECDEEEYGVAYDLDGQGETQYALVLPYSLVCGGTSK